MNAVLPEGLSPVTARRSVLLRTSAVRIGTLSRARRSRPLMRLAPAVSQPRLAGRLHRDVEHDVGQDLPDDAAQGRLVGGGRRRPQPPRAAARDTSGGAPVAAGPDLRKPLAPPPTLH